MQLIRSGTVPGPEGDLAMAERWLRRGCSAYLAVWTPMDRVLHIPRSTREQLVVSESTVDFHIRNVLDKLGARNRVEAIERADVLGI